MEFTGERFHPDCVREIWYEHYHRYAFASQLVGGRCVLDLACGEGYGSAMLAAAAERVVGADCSREAIAHAHRTYRQANLDFLVADAAAVPLAAGTVDLVVSFETLEHLEPQREMLAEFERVLAPQGLVLISSPDKRTYSDEREYDNEYHVRELYLAELEALLGEVFPAVRLFGQKLAFHSLIWNRDGAAEGRFSAVQMDRAETSPEAWRPEAVYWIAICAREPAHLEQVSITDLSLFADQDESVYAHYEHEIRKNMAAGRVLAEREERIAALERELTGRSRRRGWLTRLLEKFK